MARLSALPALGGPDGPLVDRRPELAVRRASKRPRSRLGFAVPEEHRLSVTVYPGIRRGDIEETLLHELVHRCDRRLKDAGGDTCLPTFRTATIYRDILTSRYDL